MSERILIIQVNWIGDIIFTTPFIRAVREAYPDGYIACLVHPRCAELFENNPRIDRVIVYDEEGAHRSILGKLRLAARLRAERFNIAFILHRSMTKALLVRLAGIATRIGYATKGRSALLTLAVAEPPAPTHRVEYFLGLARAAGIPTRNCSYEFFVSDHDRYTVAEMLSRAGITVDGRLIVICPGGNWDPKRWPKRDFARLADELSVRYGARIAIAGAKKDITLAEEIRDMMTAKPVIMCGRTTLSELAALLARADLVIANDTGPMHLAVAMRTKTIALFGPTSPAITGPYGEGAYSVVARYNECAIPCYDRTCGDFRCMSAITVEDVLGEAEILMRS